MRADHDFGSREKADEMSEGEECENNRRHS
jgi:hypothetical protein